LFDYIPFSAVSESEIWKVQQYRMSPLSHPLFLYSVKQESSFLRNCTINSEMYTFLLTMYSLQKISLLSNVFTSSLSENSVGNSGFLTAFPRFISSLDLLSTMQQAAIMTNGQKH